MFQNKNTAGTHRVMMRKNIGISLRAGLSVVIALLVIAPAAVLAQGVTCPSGMEPQAGVCFPTDTGLPGDGGGVMIADVLGNFMDWILAIFGIIAIIAFVISGIQYLTAAGDESQAETAKRNMKFSIIGALVGLSAYIVINTLYMLLDL